MAKVMITQSAPPRATVGINGWSILRHLSAAPSRFTADTCGRPGSASRKYASASRGYARRMLAVPSLTRDLPYLASPPACDRREAR